MVRERWISYDETQRLAMVCFNGFQSGDAQIESLDEFPGWSVLLISQYIARYDTPVMIVN